MGALTAIAASVPLLLVAGLVLTPLFPVPPFQPPPPERAVTAVFGSDSVSYDAIFPMYLEYAAMSRIHRRGEEPGGRHGHAAFYLKGVRRVPGAPYPRLELLPEGADLSDLEAGVGVSVNKVLRNVNWIAIDGADLFYTGGVREGERIDEAACDAIVARVVATGAFDGVELYEGVIGPSSVGTDFALRLGRNVACVRVPVTRGMMAGIVDYLNAMNAHYAEDPQRNFVWNGVENNCTHLAVNALACVSGGRMLETDAGPVRRLFNLAIPANVFVDFAGAGNAVPDPAAVFNDAGARAAFETYAWMAAEPGVVVRYLPRIRDNNLLWEGDFDLYTMERPVVPLILVPPMQLIPIGSKWVWPPVYRFEQKSYRRLFSTPRTSNLAANLDWFDEAYAAEAPRPKAAGDGGAKAAFFERYRRYAAAQRARIDAATH